MGILSWLSRKKPESRQDGFVNELTGLGVPGIDKSLASSFYAAPPFQPDLCSELYVGNDVAALVVDVPVDEALREGFILKTGDVDEDDRLTEWALEAQLESKIGDAARWGRLYGAGALILGTTDSNPPWEPLDLDTVKSLDFITVLDKEEFTVNEYNFDGSPKNFFVTPRTMMGGGTTVVDASRMVMFGGAKTPKAKKFDNSGFDYSILNRIYDVISQFEAAFTNTGVLLADGNQPVFKMSGLAAALAGDVAGEDAIKKRFQLMQAARSVHNALVLDAGDGSGEPAESFERQIAQFGGLAPIMDKFILRLSSAVRIPATILMGQSPAGLSATGESDVRWFYDRTDAYRRAELTPAIRRVVQVLRHSSEWQSGDSNSLTIDWPSLWTETESEKAMARKTQAEADQIYILQSVVTPEEITLSRFGVNGEYRFETTIPDEGLAAREKALEFDYVAIAEEPQPHLDPAATLEGEEDQSTLNQEEVSAGSEALSDV